MAAVTYTYEVYYPPGYQEAEQKRPLLLFLHGAGERGNDIEKVKGLALPALLLKKELPFIVAYPQCPDGQYWSVELLDNWLNQLLTELKDRVDLNKIYLTGISMGGYGTWHWATAFPDKFAAIAPICGGGDPARALRLKNVPVWAFHGAKDYIVPLSESAQMVEALKRVGGKVTFTIYPDAAHDAWTETYHNPVLYDWFLTYHL
jgi:predicted peptidase